MIHDFYINIGPVNENWTDEDSKIADRLYRVVTDELYKIKQEDEQARFDELIDKNAAEHRERSKKKEKPAWFHGLINGRICIVFNAPYEYGAFRAKFSDILLLPSASDVYAKYPEIAENKWPVVIHSARNPSSQESMTWAITQSDYRNNRLISGLDWFEYDELEDYDCAKKCNAQHIWFVAREMRGKNTQTPGEDYGNGRNA